TRRLRWQARRAARRQLHPLPVCAELRALSTARIRTRPAAGARRYQPTLASAADAGDLAGCVERRAARLLAAARGATLGGILGRRSFTRTRARAVAARLCGGPAQARGRARGAL